MSRVLFVVSADLASAPSGMDGPRKDYAVLADALGATVLDRSAVRRSGLSRLLARLVGVPVAQAWLAFRQREDCPAILTNGEHLGIPLALLLKLARQRIPHVTIGHRPSATKKRPFFRWLRAHTHIDRMALHATRQYDLARSQLGIPAERLALVPYQVDTAFWRPQALPEERLICSAGLEYRDYPTLFEAVAGLDVRVVVGAASHWSRRHNTARDVQPPANVEIAAFDYHR